MTITRLPSGGGPTEELTRAAVERALGDLLGRQLADGSWLPERPVTAPAIAEYLLLARVLKTADAAPRELQISQLRALQLADGGWARSPGGEPDLGASVKAYAALRLSGASPDGYQLALAAGWIRRTGGLASVDWATMAWLALAGAWPPGPARRHGNWISAVHVPAARIIAEWSAADWFSAGYSRPEFTASLSISYRAQMMVPLGVIRVLGWYPPVSCELRELMSQGLPVHPASESDGRTRHWSRSAGGLRSVMLARAERQILADQDPDGSWCQWPLRSALSLVALAGLGYAGDAQVITSGLSWFARSAGQPGWDPGADPGADPGIGAGPGSGRAIGRTTPPVGVTAPPVGVTAMAARALADAGLPSGHPALARAASWLAAQDRRAGWRAWPGVPRPGARDWPCAAAAAGAVEAHSLAGRFAGAGVRHGVVWLLRAQRADGAWTGPDGRADEVSTGLAARALATAGVRPGTRSLRSAVRWLAARQRPDGGWSGEIATAVATSALLAAGASDEVMVGGSRRLADRLGGSRPALSEGDPGGAAVRMTIDVLCYQLSALGQMLTGRWAVGGDGDLAGRR